MDKNLKYQLAPQWKVYEEIGYKWLPFIMFKEPPNYRSNILNTDDRGFRFNSKNLIQNESIFKIKKKNKTSLILGGSFAFGVGSTSDQNTISGYLSKSENNYLNLSGSAHIGFQELISIFSNINLIDNIEEIIFISGINDLYLSNFFETYYPDTFYFNSEFITNMNNQRNDFRKKFFKFFINKIYPNTISNDNITNLKKENLFKFLTSSKFRKSFEDQNMPKFSLEEKMERNFKIYNVLGNYFNCKVSFYLQPGLNWSKEKSKEEDQLFNYSNYFYKEKTEFINKLFTKENYEYLKNLLSKFSKKYNVSFFDLNEYFKNNLEKNDWVFLDSIHINDKGNKLIADIINTK